MSLDVSLHLGYHDNRHIHHLRISCIPVLFLHVIGHLTNRNKSVSAQYSTVN